MVPHNPQHFTDCDVRSEDRFVCHLVVNNDFKTRSTSGLAVLSYFKISNFSHESAGLKQAKRHNSFVLNVCKDEMSDEWY